MAPPGSNPVLRGLVQKCQPASKGKRPRTEEIPERVEPITVVPPSPQQLPKKRKDREHKKDKEHHSSSRCSSTRLRPSTTFRDRAMAMKFFEV